MCRRIDVLDLVLVPLEGPRAVGPEIPGVREVVVDIDPLTDHGASSSATRRRAGEGVESLPRVDHERQVLTQVSGVALLVSRASENCPVADMKPAR